MPIYRVNVKDRFDPNEKWMRIIDDSLRGQIDQPFRFYFDDKLLPITPAKWSYEPKNQNETIHMANGDEKTWIKQNGLAVWNFEFTICELIQFKRDYEFDEGLIAPEAMIEYLDSMRNKKKPIQFIVTDGILRNLVNEKVSLEDWSVEQDSDNANDHLFTVTLQQYREWHNMEADINLNHHLILAKYAKGWRT